jgi:hypothetical protein
VKDNIFILGDSAPEEAVTFAPNGHDLVFTGNTFQNKPVTIVVDPTCKNPQHHRRQPRREDREEACRFQSRAAEDSGRSE